jgi:ABC-type multidrug transport system ATPase subunit
VIVLKGVSAKGKHGIKLTNIELDAGRGVTAIVGTARDGTTLLCDVIDKTRKPAAHARVSLDAPLPDAMRVDEVCKLAAELRGDAAADVLTPLRIEALARRSTRSLAVDERRAVALAIALGSAAVKTILIEEPLAAMAVATRIAADAIRERAKTACVLATTASPRDATRVGDRIAVLVDGILTPIEESNTVSRDSGSLRVIVAASQGKSGAAALIGALGREEAVGRIDSAAFAAGRATTLTVHGDDLAALASAVTKAIADAKVDVDLIEPSVLPLDAIRAQIASTS